MKKIKLEKLIMPEDLSLVVLIQYVGNLPPAAFVARALEGSKDGDGEIIVTTSKKMFLFGTGNEVNKMIGGFPDVQSSWKAAGNANAEVFKGTQMKTLLADGKIGVSETFCVALPHMFPELE